MKIRPPRGIIYDRKGRPIVENALTFDISLVPEDAPNLEEYDPEYVLDRKNRRGLDPQGPG